MNFDDLLEQIKAYTEYKTFVKKTLFIQSAERKKKAR
jgi:hypothetical protein